MVFCFIFISIILEHVGTRESSLEVGDWLFAWKSRSWETKSHKTRPRIANKFTDLGHGYYEATRIFEKIQRKFNLKIGLCLYRWKRMGRSLYYYLFKLSKSIGPWNHHYDWVLYWWPTLNHYNSTLLALKLF